MIGSKLGVHEITAKLGEGGMGVVYRATDTRLNREVAIKVLPAGFTEDADRLARFTREAQLLAQLQHPNIASVYGFEHADGVRGLVMELVEGPTLAERLALGPLPLEDVLAIARQIAEALEAAHAKGIVHRDLKPANVKLSQDGKVKVLDFGLAKALDPAAGDSSSVPPMQSPTLTLGATMQGVVLGTAGYMAPEQAKGLPADKRADIWAFGVVLYEMLSGRVLFEGETAPEILAGVIRQDIDLSLLPAGTPASVRAVLRRCLERNPRNRLHDIADARILLDETTTPAAESASAAAPRPPGRRSVLALGIAAALAVGVAAGWLVHRPPSASSSTEERWTVPMPAGTTYAGNDLVQLAISPDGKLRAAVAVDAQGVGRIAVHGGGDGFEARTLPDTEGAKIPFFSPDGAWIGYFREAALYKVPVMGGPPMRLAAATFNARGATWSRDGFIYFSGDVQGGLSRVPEGGGPAESATKVDANQRTHRWPDALPDGRAVLFTMDDGRSTEFYDDARIEAVVPATGERKVVLEGASMARYAGGDRLIFARGGALYAISFDPRTLATKGGPVQVLQGVASDTATGGASFSLSENGSVLWAPGETSVATRYVWADRKGTETAATIPAGSYNEAVLSRDGRHAALIGGPGGASDLWIADLERGSVIRLTTQGSILRPVWSPDGARIAYASRPLAVGSQWRILWRQADGSREAETVVTSDRYLAPTGFTPDGRSLVYTRGEDPVTVQNIWMIDLATPGKPRLVLQDAFLKGNGAVSPDGRWLAYISNEGGQAGIYVRPFPTGEGRWQIAMHGLEPRWSPDGREIFYRDDRKLQSVRIDTAHGFSAGRPEALFDRVWDGAAYTYGVAPDGARFFTIRSPQSLGSLRAIYLDLGFGRRLAASRAPGG